LRDVTIARWLTGTSPEQRASDIATALELAASRPQEIDVAATYPLAQIAAGSDGRAWCVHADRGDDETPTV
jgi:hypothetical protein